MEKNFLETAVKAGFELVSHFTPLGFLNAFKKISSKSCYPVKNEMPMPDLFLIFNHEITPLQEEDARRSLGFTRIIDLPPDLKILWRQIPPDLPEIFFYLEPVMEWLEGMTEGPPQKSK